MNSLEEEWNRRRRALLDDEVGARRKRSLLEEELFKRSGGGGSADRATPFKAFGYSNGGKGSSIERDPLDGGASARTMEERLNGIAKGGQPAVVKMASYGGGARFGAMANYISRDGEVVIETENGEKLSGRGDLERLREEWSPLFQNRSDSRDVAEFLVTVEDGLHRDAEDLHRSVREVLHAGFGDRRLAYTIFRPRPGRLDIKGVLVLRDKSGERLTGDGHAARIIQDRYDRAGKNSEAQAVFSFTAHGNGVDYTTAKLKALVETSGADVRDERGREIPSVKEAGELSQRDWRHHLHSRKGRDVMHVIMSARAGTDADKFHAAAREFLAEQFAGYRFAFSIHDPMHDPKEAKEGGKRPHIHVHALVAMRNEHGDRIVTSPQVFRQWRVLLAEKARAYGIAMEMTDRRELASAPAFTHSQVKPVSRAGRTEHVGTSEAAQKRYDNKRAKVRSVGTTKTSLEYSFEAKRVWSKIAATNDNTAAGAYASRMEIELTRALNSTLEGLRLSVAKGEFSSEFEASIRHIAGIVREGEVMRNDMTREQFDNYAAGVSNALANFEKIVEPTEREEFERIAKAANDSVSAQRQLIDLKDELEKVQAEARPNSIVRDFAYAIAELSPTRQAAMVLGHAVEQVAGPKDAEEDHSVKADKVEQRKSDLPAEITERYFVQQAASGTVRVFSNSKATRELFQDAGERLRAKTFEPTAVRLMVETAAHRGWSSIEISGSKEFRREVWLEGQARGIAVKGYQPSELDWQEVGRREQSHLKNEIRHVEERISGSEATLATRKDAAPVTDAAVVSSHGNDSRGFRQGISGVLVEQGVKPYQGKPENEPSPYAVLKTDEGDRTLWGVDIPDAITRADAKVGDVIMLRETGTEKVEKTIFKEVDGKKISSVALVDRRMWQAEVMSERAAQTSLVEASIEERSVVERKAEIHTNNGSADEPESQSRLGQLEQELKREQGDQER